MAIELSQDVLDAISKSPGVQALILELLVDLSVIKRSQVLAQSSLTCCQSASTRSMSTAGSLANKVPGAAGMTAQTPQPDASSGDHMRQQRDRLAILRR